MHHRKFVGKNIRVLRVAKGWSQEKLAIRSKLSPDYLSKVERGVVNIGLDSLARIADTLKVKLIEFFRDQS
jgi:transcriptional regulator with XRE-family HTH domain